MSPPTRIKTNARAAVIDDDVSLARALAMHLEERGLSVEIFLEGEAALEGLRERPVDLVFLDVRLGDTSGLDVLRRLRDMHSDVYVMMITAFHDMETTVEATKLGAFDYIVKPLDLDRVDDAIERALVHRQESRARVAVQATEENESDALRRSIIGSSPAMLEIYKTMGQVAPSRVTVLISGESGTGKELIARAIHNFSDRSGPFLSVNCAMLSDEFLVSELFGHEAGSFTGATSRKLGKFELADHGTVLLDEASEINPVLQAKLLRFLQEREFERLGGTETISTDVRMIAATNRNLDDMVRRGTFRGDLFFRLDVVRIAVPPLRQRRQDIPLLVEHLLGKLSRTMGKEIRGVSEGALARLLDHSWPGNVRELENVIARSIVQSTGDTLLASELPPLGTQRPLVDRRSKAASGTLADVEREHILKVLGECDGQKSRAAARLGISRPTLDKKLSSYDVDVKRVVRSTL